MKIKTVSIIGMGALGILFGHHLSQHMRKEDLRIIADSQRIKRYQSESLYCNDEICNFNYVTPEEKTTPADLLIFAVKFNGLQDAIKAVQNQVGTNTIIISLLNGISSEGIIGQTYGLDKVVYSVAQGMDAVKVGNKLTYHNMGMICFGEINKALVTSEKVDSLRFFFEKVKLPHFVDIDMKKRMWGKFMLNVGLNQTAAVYGCDYGGIQKDGLARDTMISAMKEVMILSEKEQVYLAQPDIDYWLSILNTLNPLGKPSMQQDMEAGRKSEVELFAGTVLALAKNHGVSCPTNQFLYDKVKEKESKYK